MTAMNTSGDAYRAWLIDMDGTLYRALPLRALMAAELAVCGWNAVRILRQFRKEHERLRHRGEPAASTPYREQIERTANAVGRPAEEVERIVRCWMQKRPQKWLVRCLRRRLVQQIELFRAAGGRTAVVSDYPASDKLAALGIAGLFDAVVASGETESLRRLKPAPDGYLLAAETLGLAPNQCLVIGDRDDTDGAAASTAGMDFLHVRRCSSLAAIQRPLARVIHAGP